MLLSFFCFLFVTSEAKKADDKWCNMTEPKKEEEEEEEKKKKKKKKKKEEEEEEEKKTKKKKKKKKKVDSISQMDPQQ